MSKSIKTRTPCSIVGGDFSGQEPRSLCSFAQDKDMQEAYIEKKDLYSVIASKCFHNSYWEDLEFMPILVDCEEHEEYLNEMGSGVIQLLITDKVFGENNTVINAENIKLGDFILTDDGLKQVKSLNKDYIYIRVELV